MNNNYSLNPKQNFIYLIFGPGMEYLEKMNLFGAWLVVIPATFYLIYLLEKRRRKILLTRKEKQWITIYFFCLLLCIAGQFIMMHLNEKQ